MTNAPHAAPASTPIRAPSIIVGLIGAGIQASRTPPMHEQEADALGLRYIYRLIDLDQLQVGVDALPDLLEGAERLGFTGLNITYPCKQAIIPLLDELSDDAQAIGAVNTVVLSGGRRVGHNTDCSGFAEGFRRGLGDVPRARVVQLGAAPGPPWPTPPCNWASVASACSTPIRRARSRWPNSSTPVSARAGPTPSASWNRRWRRPMG